MGTNLIKLGVKDKKILYALDTNSRASFSEIARKVRLHKDTVAYRIRQLELSGLISGYSVLLSYSSVGVIIFKMYFQLQGMAAQQEQEFINYLIIHKHSGWVVQCNGSWDIIAGFGVKDSVEFNKIKIEITTRYGRFISNLAVSENLEIVIYPRNYLLNVAVYKEIRLGDIREQQDLDALDRKILSELSLNARIPITVLSKKLKSTPRIIKYRINQLEKNKVIKAYKLTLNLEKVGLQFYKCFITLHNLTKHRKTTLLEYCKQNKSIVHNVISLGQWDMEPEFEVGSSQEFYQLLKKMRNEFADIIKSIETVQIQRELKFRYVI